MVNPTCDPSLAPRRPSTRVFKTLIIINIILTLTRVNGLHPQLRPGSNSTPKLSFKTIIIIIFTFMFTRVNG
jgi:hypothetical protein